MSTHMFATIHKLFWVGYILALVVGSLLPVDLPVTPEHGDKVMHFLAYCVLVFLWPRAWVGTALAMFSLGAGLGLALEIGQGILPTGRFMDIWDALSNALGAGVGVICLGLLLKRREGFWRPRRQA